MNERPIASARLPAKGVRGGESAGQPRHALGGIWVLVVLKSRASQYPAARPRSSKKNQKTCLYRNFTRGGVHSGWHRGNVSTTPCAAQANQDPQMPSHARWIPFARRSGP